MTAEEAARVVSAYDLSVGDRCVPAPLWSPARVEHQGGIVVAINVQPFPGQVVGVKVSSISLSVAAIVSFAWTRTS